MLRELIKSYKDKQRRKELRRKLRKLKKTLLSKENITKIVIGFVSFALIASYVLPYII